VRPRKRGGGRGLLTAVRRVAYEAADVGLLSPELAAGIRRVKGVRRLGVRVGNWLTPAQGRRLLAYERPPSLRGVRDHAMLAMLIGCGLRFANGAPASRTRLVASKAVKSGPLS
jgi:integrase